MFPYPSGRIHMGHVRVYAIGDLLARFKWMRGYNVLHPMGWDAFGLPAENAAIDNGVHPAVWTYENIANMRQQLRRMGISYDWDRELATCDPAYYRWEQLVFVRMFERGLAYKKRSTVNWCPSCQTVLANEQVEAGRCWRCDSEVVDQGDRGVVLQDHRLRRGAPRVVRRLPGWPERVMTMQRNWIGRSEGAEFDLPIVGRARRDADHLHDAARHVVRHDVRRARARASARRSARHRRRGARGASTRSGRRSRARRRSSGSRPTGRSAACGSRARAVNPFNGQEIPLFLADYVLMGYGTGAIMAVPGEDQRDWDFADPAPAPDRRRR